MINNTIEAKSEYVPINPLFYHGKSRGALDSVGEEKLN